MGTVIKCTILKKATKIIKVTITMTNSNILVVGKHDIDMINSAKLSVSRFSLAAMPNPL